MSDELHRQLNIVPNKVAGHCLGVRRDGRSGTVQAAKSWMQQVRHGGLAVHDSEQRITVRITERDKTTTTITVGGWEEGGGREGGEVGE